MEVVLEPHPDAVAAGSVPSESRFIKTTGNSTVNHFIKYLKIRLALDDPETKCSELSGSDLGQFFNIKIIPSGSADYVDLSGEMTLESVVAQYWKLNKPLKLYFAPSST